jgi:hypothetical protein
MTMSRLLLFVVLTPTATAIGFVLDTQRGRPAGSMGARATQAPGTVGSTPASTQ